jgi:hypothetical protein
MEWGKICQIARRQWKEQYQYYEYFAGKNYLKEFGLEMGMDDGK